MIGPMKNYKTISFDLENDRGYILSAMLEMPADEKPRAFGIFSNCFTCEKEFFAPKRVSRALAERGIAMVRFDFTGLGKSGGDFSDTNFTTNILDIKSIADKIRADFGQDVSLLVGHSFGGAASLGFAHDRPSVRAVATLGSPKDPRHVMRHFEDNAQILMKDGKVEITVAGRKYILKKQFTEDVKSHDIEQKTRDLNAALFVFHDPKDEMVTYQNAIDIYDRGSAEKYLVTIEDSGHMLPNLKDAQYMANILANWMINNKKPTGSNIKSAA